jgi:hypothetical protein
MPGDDADHLVTLVPPCCPRTQRPPARVRGRGCDPLVRRFINLGTGGEGVDEVAEDVKHVLICEAEV